MSSENSRFMPGYGRAGLLRVKKVSENALLVPDADGAVLLDGGASLDTVSCFVVLFGLFRSSELELRFCLFRPSLLSSESLLRFLICGCCTVTVLPGLLRYAWIFGMTRIDLQISGIASGLSSQ